MQYEKMTFEGALETLEKLIASLERGDLSLEDTLNKFQEGMELIRYCRKLLSNAEYRVEAILQDGEKNEYHLEK